MCRFSLPLLFDLTSTFLYLSSQVTKAESPKQSVHVILATSDYNFVSWLSQSEYAACEEGGGEGQSASSSSGLGQPPESLCPMPAHTPYGFFDAGISVQFMEVEVIGDFPEAEARAFFTWQLQFSVWQPAPPPDDASWVRIFEVCGGNAASLKEVASKWTGATGLEKGTAARLALR